jgi:hypothetical protein
LVGSNIFVSFALVHSGTGELGDCLGTLQTRLAVGGTFYGGRGVFLFFAAPDLAGLYLWVGRLNFAQSQKRQIFDMFP